jgi:hypothetical protein
MEWITWQLGRPLRWWRNWRKVHDRQWWLDNL